MVEALSNEYLAAYVDQFLNVRSSGSFRSVILLPDDADAKKKWVFKHLCLTKLDRLMISYDMSLDDKRLVLKFRRGTESSDDDLFEDDHLQNLVRANDRAGIKFALENGCEFTEVDVHEAALIAFSTGNAEIILFMAECFGPETGDIESLCDAECFTAAIANRQWSCFTMFYRFWRPNLNDMFAAIKSRNVNMVKTLVELYNINDFDEDVIYKAAESGCFAIYDFLELASDNAFPESEMLLASAVKGGCMKIIADVHSSWGGRPGPYELATAIEMHHRHVVQAFLDNGVRTNTTCFFIAVEQADAQLCLELEPGLDENVTVLAIMLAVRPLKISFFEWMIERKPGIMDTFDDRSVLYDEVAKIQIKPGPGPTSQQKIQFLQFLLTTMQIPKSSLAIGCAAFVGDYNSVVWLINHGFGVLDRRILSYQSIRGDNLTCIRHLVSKGLFLPYSSIIADAVLTDNPAIVEFLVNEYPSCVEHADLQISPWGGSRDKRMHLLLERLKRIFIQ